MDCRNSPGIHLIFDGIKEERIQIITLDDLFSKIAPRYDIMELWFVKVDSGSSSAGLGTASSAIPPMALSASSTIPPMSPDDVSAMPAHELSTIVKPLGIKNLGHTYYLSTLLQMYFGLYHSE